MTIPRLTDGETWVYEFSKHPFSDVSDVVWWWQVGLKRFDTSEITLVADFLFYREVVGMANQSRKSVKDDKVDFRGFVNITLTEEEYAQVDLAMAAKKPPEIGVQLDYLLETGKVTLSFVRGSMNATLTYLEGENAGIAVSAYSDTMLEAVLLLRLKISTYGNSLPALLEGGGTKRKRG